MKKYVIQDVEDGQYFCNDNTWSPDINDALIFDDENKAWEEANVIFSKNNYVLTVISVTK